MVYVYGEGREDMTDTLSVIKKDALLFYESVFFILY